MLNKIIKLIIGGFMGAIFLGAIGFFIMILYGGNYGCFSLVDNLFKPLRGYESCGLFGLYLGVIAGAIFGLIITKKYF